jgi:hypothetical protein
MSCLAYSLSFSDRARPKQANLVGPAGYVSMEDGCVGGFVQRGNAGAGDARAIVEMGGSATENSESWVTEASVKGLLEGLSRSDGHPGMRAMADGVAGTIGRVQAAYARCIDNGDLEAWPDFFEDRCTYNICGHGLLQRLGRVPRHAALAVDPSLKAMATRLPCRSYFQVW